MGSTKPARPSRNRGVPKRGAGLRNDASRVARICNDSRPDNGRVHDGDHACADAYGYDPQMPLARISGPRQRSLKDKTFET
jgi:hypothetical protein